MEFYFVTQNPEKHKVKLAMFTLQIFYAYICDF